MQPRLAAPLCAAALTLSSVHAQPAFEGYGAPYRAITLPPHPPGSSQPAGAALADGRLVVVSGLSILRESAPGSSQFETVAVLDSAAMGGGTDAAFLRVSPDGQRIAVGGGANRPVAVFHSSVLPAGGLPVTIGPGLASFFNVPHYDAAWADGSRLAITAGDFGSASRVTMLDVTSDPAAPANPAVITNIRGASGGVAFDSAGRLYTGNGFDLEPGGSTTGTIRAFDASLLGGTAPADFETGGVLIGGVLSATSLSFDLEGNLLVGGGNFTDMDVGYLGVISADALGDALAGLGPIDPGDPLDMRRLTPDADPFAFYGSAFNAATGEVYATLTDFASGATTWYATVPAPAAGALLGMMGLLAARRSRHG